MRAIPGGCRLQKPGSVVSWAWCSTRCWWKRMCYVGSSHLTSEITEQWTGIPHHSGLSQQRIGPLWDPAAFCITLMISQKNGFGGASSRLILAQKKLNPATFLYSLIPMWDTLAGCVSLLPIQGCLCAMHLLEARQGSASVPTQFTHRLLFALPVRNSAALCHAATFCNPLSFISYRLWAQPHSRLCVPPLPPSGHL